MLTFARITPKTTFSLTSGSTDFRFPMPRPYSNFSYQIDSLRAIAVGGGAGSASIGIFTSPGGAGLTLVSTVLLSSLTASNSVQSLTLASAALNKILDVGVLFIRVVASGTNSCTIQMSVSVYEIASNFLLASSATRSAGGRAASPGILRDFIPATSAARVAIRKASPGVLRDFIPVTSAVRVANRVVPSGALPIFLPATEAVRVANRIASPGVLRDFIPVTSAVRVANRVVPSGTFFSREIALSVVRVANRIAPNGVLRDFLPATSAARVANRVIPDGALVISATSAVRVANRVVPDGVLRDFLPATSAVRVANPVVPSGTLI
jgi:hypothetical protein